MAVTLSCYTLDFDDIDLSTPRSSPKDTLVPTPMGAAADLSSSKASKGSPVPALPLTSLTPGTKQHHPLNPTVTDGHLSTMGSPSNPPVGMKSSLRPPVTAGDSQCRPPGIVGVNEDCRHGPGAGYPGAIADGGKRRSSPLDQTPGSSGTSCPTNTDPRALLITEAAAKQAFQEYGNSRCCYGGSPAKDMMTEELQPFNTYRYSLETFTESRFCEWITEQYTGQHVDPTNAGSVLQPWEIPVVVPDMFKDGTQTMKVPNSTAVKTCSHCKGMGKNMCLKCHGTGRIQCMWCNGSGRRLQMEMCQQCYGIGTESCRMCNSRDIQTCVTCAGKGQVLTHLQLSTTWKNNKYQFISDHPPEFSPDLFHAVHGERIHTDEQLSASPLLDFPDSSITWASQNALEQHGMQFSSSCRVLRQRQSVELIPLTKVQYIWKGKTLNYFVYGVENKVHVQNYPQKCCCAVM